MSNETAQATTDAISFDPPQPGDPRHSYATVTMVAADLIAGVQPDQLANTTPCPDFTVKDLLEHTVLVMRRVAALGDGIPWHTISEEPVDSGWHEQFMTAAGDAHRAWTDPAKLDAMHEVPWGTFPGAPVMWTYVAELATHSWDIAQATGQPLAIDGDVLQPALDGMKFGLPAEGRDAPEVPFGPVVVAPDGASVLEQLAGWFGRQVA